MLVTINQAKGKLAEQLKNFSGGQKEEVISKPVARVLMQFCEDDERFAEAIMESEETLSSCCKAIMSDVSTNISDIEVYKRAAEFYYPTATVRCKIEIFLNGGDDSEQNIETPFSSKIVSIFDL